MAGGYVLWFLLLLAAGKILACGLTLGIGGSGGVFAPSLFVGVTSGMAFGEVARHLLGPAAGPAALYAVVAMGAVFTSAARAPLTSVASVIELTGDYGLTLPVMLAVAIATACSRALAYGSIYTTKLLRRGADIDRSAPWRAFGELKAADAMRPFPAPLRVSRPGGAARAAPDLTHLAGQVSWRPGPQAVYAGESLAQTLRQLSAYGRDGLPVLSADGSQVQGWITNTSVLRAVATAIGSSPGQDSVPAGPAPPDPLHGYQVIEITLAPGSPAVGRRLGSVQLPSGAIPVSVLRDRSLADPDPGLTLNAGDRLSLLTPALGTAAAQPLADLGPAPDGHAPAMPPASQADGPADR